jgi:hypothetical protein
MNRTSTPVRIRISRRSIELGDRVTLELADARGTRTFNVKRIEQNGEITVLVSVSGSIVYRIDNETPVFVTPAEGEVWG